MPTKNWGRSFRGIGALRNAFQRRTESGSQVEKVTSQEQTFDVLPSMVPQYRAPTHQDLTDIPAAFAAWPPKSGSVSPTKSRSMRIRSLHSVSTTDSGKSNSLSQLQASLPGESSSNAGEYERPSDFFNKDFCKREVLLDELVHRGAKVLFANSVTNRDIDALAAGSIEEESGSEKEDAAIIVAVQVPSTMKERGVVERVVATEPQVPTIVLLLRGDGPAACNVDPASRRAMLQEETSSFLQIGADGVELEPRSIDDLEDTLTIWISCATQRRLAAIQQKTDNEDFEHDGEALQQRAEKREIDLFWGAAHKIFKDFPKLAKDLAEPELGGKFGKSHTVDELLGSGGGGDVFLVRTADTRQPRALKAVPKQDLHSYHRVEAVAKEIQALRKLKHPNIVSFFGAAHTCEHLLILQECPGTRNLHRLQRESTDYKLPRVLAHSFFQQISAAIAYCHSLDTAHRDLKQENIIVCRDNSTIKLIDFGTAERLNVGIELCGTVPFIAPEVLSNEVNSYDAGKADVWSMGMLLLEMLCGLNFVPDLLRWPMPAEPQPSFAKDLRALVSEWTPLARAIEGKISLTPDLRNLIRDSMNSVVGLRQTSADLVTNAWLTQEGELII